MTTHAQPTHAGVKNQLRVRDVTIGDIWTGVQVSSFFLVFFAVVSLGTDAAIASPLRSDLSPWMKAGVAALIVVGAKDLTGDLMEAFGGILQRLGRKWRILTVLRRVGVASALVVGVAGLELFESSPSVLKWALAYLFMIAVCTWDAFAARVESSGPEDGSLESGA